MASAMSLLSAPPCAWAALGMGSMSREEMCPYSDIEFAFALESASELNLTYFRTVALIIEMKIVNLNETPFPVFGSASESPVPDGLCLDSGGNTPLVSCFCFSLCLVITVFIWI
jgi:hypothetical protein